MNAPLAIGLTLILFACGAVILCVTRHYEARADMLRAGLPETRNSDLHAAPQDPWSTT